MLTIITPCSRPIYLSKLYESIQFDKIDKWIIVYDTSKDRTYPKSYEGHPKIIETECNDEGIVGHPQRNHGLTLVEDGFIYFLDDDNIMHPTFWSILEEMDPMYFYTFDQNREQKGDMISVLWGNQVWPNAIDTAMFVVHKRHIQGIRWMADKYNADGIFISTILGLWGQDHHRYVPKIGCYYNFLTRS